MTSRKNCIDDRNPEASPSTGLSLSGDDSDDSSDVDELDDGADSVPEKETDLLPYVPQCQTTFAEAVGDGRAWDWVVWRWKLRCFYRQSKLTQMILVREGRKHGIPPEYLTMDMILSRMRAESAEARARLGILGGPPD